jgi:hypothetical protein
VLKRLKEEKTIREMQKETKSIELNFYPFVGVGDLKFGTSIEFIIEKRDFNFKVENDNTNWLTFENEKLGLNLYFENNLLISISCFKTLVYKGINIIGLTISELIETLVIKSISLPDKIFINEFEFQTVYEIDEYGLQIWIENNKIVTVIVSPNFED